MVFEAFLHPSMTSPPPDVFGSVARAALAAEGAMLAEDGETVTLADGTQLSVFLDHQDDIAMITIDESQANASAVGQMHALAMATRSFVITDGVALSLPQTGAVIPSLAMAFPAPVEIADREQFIAWFLGGDDDEGASTDYTYSDEELEAAALAATPPVAAAIVSRAGRSLFQRLSDALFGKSI